jgi:hypothetical protein
MRGGAVIAVCVAGLWLLLIATNLYAFGRVERDQPCDYTLCARPKSIAANAGENAHPIVSGRYVFYYGVGDLLRGAQITVPPWMAEESQWHLERLSGVRVVVDDVRRILDPQRVRSLRRAATWHGRFLRKRRGHEVIDQKIHIVVDDPRGEYVIATTDAKLGELFILSPERYAEAALR